MSQPMNSHLHMLFMTLDDIHVALSIQLHAFCLRSVQSHLIIEVVEKFILSESRHYPTQISIALLKTLCTSLCVCVCVCTRVSHERILNMRQCEMHPNKSPPKRSLSNKPHQDHGPWAPVGYTDIDDSSFLPTLLHKYRRLDSTVLSHGPKHHPVYVLSPCMGGVFNTRR